MLILGHTLLPKLYINAVITLIYLQMPALKSLHRLRYKQFAENMHEKTVSTILSHYNCKQDRGSDSQS